MLASFKFSLASLLLLLTTGCQAGSQQIDGLYRYGHEVNTVCTGVPEACYWLVDTPDELRQRLKQQVAGKPPYTPVCLKLIAELSDEKADGFGLDYDGSIRVVQLLGGCDGVKETGISLQDLQHHRFVLERINNMTLMQYAHELGFTEEEPLQKSPVLDFGEQGFVSGSTGCNQISGQASVTDNTLTLGPLASTRMYCPGFSGELELQLSMHYDTGLAITRVGQWLVLQAGTTKLEYHLKDWVQ
jgi:heat shock protein HslJ